ncbi:S9 family peptidase [Atopomonas sediminilitoris]|uniref:S9 family peptidase n=1 Tax=Atopomonas sediminilitoris TaxID=2919919 RepID=UPI001F4DA3B0|nr:S9 family peptidase [Atopomonas sediminilitoris]MCJ8168904.1 S9 family peptidase [Atopomonas sediminilitoris]
MLAPIAHRANTADPYAWLEERDTPAVLAYLNAENAYWQHALSGTEALQQQLFEEIRGRIRETDLSLPIPRGNYLYYQRTRAGDEHPRLYRCLRQGDSLEVDSHSQTLLLDLNQLADELGEDGYLTLGDYQISPDHQQLAYSLDCQGDEVYRLFVRDLSANTTREIELADADGSLAWAADNQTLFALRLDASHRPAFLQRIDADGTHHCVHHEADERFFLNLARSSDETFLILTAASKTSSECWHLPAHTPQATWQCLAPRQAEHEYYADHGHWCGQAGWVIRSNQAGINFALYVSDSTRSASQPWQCVIAHNPEVMLEGFTLTQQAAILSLRVAALTLLEVHRPAHAPVRVELPDALGTLDVLDVLEYHSPVARLHYQSLNRPAQVRALDLRTDEQSVLKQTPVEGGFAPEDYRVWREWATAADGTRIPISLIAKPDTLQAPAPLYLYGYGAYGECLDPWFSHARLSLLERGFVFAVAHVRGGGEGGEAWYRAGKLAHKANSFSDFIACAEHLIRQQLTQPQQLVIAGGSAGGLLIGNVINQRPELFAAAIADVPFVDVLNTMRRPELPLTVTEYEEWGNPAEGEVAARLASYAPYENVHPQPYPALWITAGYHDTRVQYWEAAKWLAKLRVAQQGDAPLYLKTDFGAGHGGQSGRYQALKEVALEYAFILHTLKLEPTPAQEPSA